MVYSGLFLTGNSQELYMVALADWVEMPKYCPTGQTSQQLWTSRLIALYYWLITILVRLYWITARCRVQSWDNISTNRMSILDASWIQRYTKTYYGAGVS